MDELTKQTVDTAGATPAAGAVGATPTAATPTAGYTPKTYQQTMDDLSSLYRQNQDSINQMYDARQQSTLSNLEAAYQQNQSNLQAARDKIDPAYTEQANAVAAQYERQRRNNNIQAMANGLNTGAGSQMALAQSANYQSNYSNLMKAKQAAINEADRNLNDLTVQYNAAVNEAIANNDYEKASKLYQELNNNYSRVKDAENQAYQRQAANADLMAQYGDFSGYATLGYSQEWINNATLMWLSQNGAQNGDLAYKSGALDKAYADGLITAEQYKNIHGGYPAGYSTGGGGGGGYWSPSSTTPQKTTKVTDSDIVNWGLKNGASYNKVIEVAQNENKGGNLSRGYGTLSDFYAQKK